MDYEYSVYSTKFRKYVVHSIDTLNMNSVWLVANVDERGIRVSEDGVQEDFDKIYDFERLTVMFPKQVVEILRFVPCFVLPLCSFGNPFFLFFLCFSEMSRIVKQNWGKHVCCPYKCVLFLI